MGPSCGREGEAPADQEPPEKEPPERPGFDLACTNSGQSTEPVPSGLSRSRNPTRQRILVPSGLSRSCKDRREPRPPMGPSCGREGEAPADQEPPEKEPPERPGFGLVCTNTRRSTEPKQRILRLIFDYELS